MGGRKFHLGRPIKNAEIKKRNASTLVVSIPRSILQIHVCPQLSLSLCSEEQPGKPADDQHLTVSLPRSAFVNSRVTSLQQLTSRVSMLTVSFPWVITSYLPLILCRIEVSGDHQPILEVSLTIDATLQWTATVLHNILYPTTSVPLFSLPHSIKAPEDVYCLLRFFSQLKVCVGNPDAGLIEQWKKRSSSLHYSSGKGLLHCLNQQNEDVLFHWTLISATWDDELAAKLMNMIVDLWITIRGFSLASAWIEEYKGATKKTLQKSKPLRTQIS